MTLLTGIAELMAEPDDAHDWLVDDRFACGSVNLIAGRPKGGKSTLARALALAVARGDRWLGHRCNFGHVVYIALEDKRSEVRRHLRAMGATGQEPIRFLIGSAPRDLLAQLSAMVQAGDRIDLLIIDTAQRLLTVKDTNDYALVTAAFEPVLALARTHGTCIVLLHHAGKADRAGIDSILGSTAWAASVDNVVFLNRKDRYRLISSVQRIGSDLDQSVVVLDETTGDVRLGGSRYLADLDHITAAMRELVVSAGAVGIRRDELLADVEARRDLKLKALHRLAAEPTIQRSGAGTRNSPHVCRVAAGTTNCQSANESVCGSGFPLKEREPEMTSLNPAITTEPICGSRTYTGSEVPQRPDDERY